MGFSLKRDLLRKDKVNRQSWWSEHITKLNKVAEYVKYLVKNYSEKNKADAKLRTDIFLKIEN